MRKRIFASLLALVMLLSLLPTTVLAASEDGTDDETPAATVETSDSDADSATPDEPETPEDGDDDNYYETDEATDPTKPSVEDQLAELIAALPDPEDIAPEDEEQVEAVYEQIAEIYAFAKENGLDVEDNKSVNAVIAALYPAEPLEETTLAATSGNCGAEGNGSSVTWELSESGTDSNGDKTYALTISGTGAMKDFTVGNGADDRPWANVVEQITAVNFGDSVTTIGNSAFRNCTQLKTFTFHNGLISIGFAAFSGSGLEGNYVLPSTLTTLGSSQGGSVFSGTKITSIDLSSTKITEIPKYAFNECDNLSSVTLPESCKVIGNSAFLKCTSLTAITIPDSVETIDGHAFNGSGLMSVKLPMSLATLGTYAFANCATLKTVQFQKNPNSIGERAFSNCSVLAKVDMANNNAVSTIGVRAFGHTDENKTTTCIIYLYNQDALGVFTSATVAYDTSSVVFAITNRGTIASISDSSNTFDTPNYNDLPFDGWYADEEFSGNSAVSPSKAEESASYPTYYAKWGATITFSANGGSGSMTDQAIVPGQTTTLNAMNGLTGQSGYAFTGWNTKADGTGDFYADGASVVFDGSVTLYAQWSDKAAVIGATGYDSLAEAITASKSGDTVVILKESSDTVTIPTGVTLSSGSVSLKGTISGTDVTSVWAKSEQTLYWVNDQWMTRIDGGNCGPKKGALYADTVKWELYRPDTTDNSEGEYFVRVVGAGKMGDDASTSTNTYAWRNYASQITGAEICEGVTSIGAYSFAGTGLTEIEIADSVIEVGAGAFRSSAIRYFKFGENVQTIGGINLFSGATAALSVDMTHTTKIETYPKLTFADSSASKHVLYLATKSQLDRFQTGSGSGDNTIHNSWMIALAGEGAVVNEPNDDDTNGYTANVTHNGNTLSGWYKPDGTAATGFASIQNYGGRASTNDSFDASNLWKNVYYAVYPYQITFDGNGGTGNISDNTFYYAPGLADDETISISDKTCTLPSDGFTRVDYDFAGWNTKADGTGTAYAASANVPISNQQITKLYAQWTKKIGESTNYTVNAIVDQTYTGAAIEPPVVVKNSSTGDVIAPSEYTVTYSDNTNAGTAKVTVAIGTDTAEVEFEIVKDNSPTVDMADVSVTYGTGYTMNATARTSAGNEITDGTITIKYYTNEACSEDESETAPTNAGTYYAKATLTGTGNYAEASKVAKITISNATFSVTATGYSGTYDGQGHSITVTADGAKVTYSTDGENYSDTNPTFTNAGTSTVYYKAKKANHDDVTGSVSVEITKALLTITANNQTIYVGGTLPEYTYTVSGLVENDTEAVITTKPTMTCSATDGNTAGTYTITASNADAGDNYTIQYVNGSLTVADTGNGEAFKVETSDLTSVPNSLSERYKSVDELTTALKTEITKTNSSVSTSNIVVYDVTLMVNEDGRWEKADAEHFPASGKLTVTLPYPDGTNSSYTFTVVHMFTTSDFDKTPGDTEKPTVTKTTSGIQFEVTGLSPISVGWTAPRSTGGGGGGSSSSTYAVTVDSAKNGTVKADHTSASKGATVTLTVTPKDGYELDELTVTDKNGKSVKITEGKNGKYTFTMPASKVTVEASFVEIEAAPDQGLPFVDVAENAYYYDAVAWAVENGITGGTSATTFSPNQACTRAQAVTFLWRAAGSPAPKTVSNPFADVSTSAYYYDAVLWAVENGITAGTSATTFSPDNTCTRGQIVTFLWRADGSPAASGSSFADVSTDAYYAGPVAWAVAEGITAGTSATTFSPNDACTRAQIVTFIYRANA